MEVETRAALPGPAPRHLSEGPSYSPITPERGPTPAARDEHEHEHENGTGTVTGNQVQAHYGDQSAADHQPNRSAAVATAMTTTINTMTGTEALPGPSLSVAEKLRIGEHSDQPHDTRMDLSGSDREMLKLHAFAGADRSHQAFNEGVNPFPNGNPAFQPISVQDLQDAEAMLPPLIDDSAFMESAASGQDSEPNRIRAFAKLEFDDGQFYMNTYAIEIGRDRDAARQAERRTLQEHDRKESEGRSRDGSNADLERAQKHADPAMSAAASVVSGGIMHMGDGDERSRRKKKRSKSAGSSSRGQIHQENIGITKKKTNYQALANASLLERNAARPVDLTNMMPSPDECPLIPIHPPPNTEGAFTGHKGISRKHVRIAYNHEKGYFELHVLGKNGCFLDGAHMERGEVIALASGSEIQIGGVSVRFVLPNVPDGETGTDLRSDAVSQSAMSFDFEDGRGENAGGEQDSESPTTDNEDDRYRELRLAQKAEALLSDGGEDDGDDDDAMEIDVRKSRPKIMLKIGLNAKPKPTPPAREAPPPKRKVGRPPKNGIMSKREEAELRRKEKEAAKAQAKEKKQREAKAEAEAEAEAEVETQAEEAAVKMEEDEPEEPPSSPTEQRKAAGKKKPKEPVPAPFPIVESIEKEAEPPTTEVDVPAPAPKPPKKERPAKPPRSPSPVFNEAELTAEQLAKPTASYVVLIHEALSNHPEGRMSLPQIYRAIERRYPYYKLRVQTVGWQSSVRHNLSQHPAFVKIERDGKGWMWGLDPNVSIEREKKRRPSPPPMQAGGWNAPAANGFNRSFPQNVYSGANGQMPQNPYAVFPNNQAAAGRGFPPGNPMPRPPFPGQQPTPGTGTGATYQSPYGNRLPGQPPAENGQASQPPNQGIPQMPAPYLNQNKNSSSNPSTPVQLGGQQPPALPKPAQASAQGQALPAGSVASPGGPLPGQGQTQPTQRAPAPAMPAFSPPPSNNPHGVPPPVWAAIERFRSALKAAMSAIPDGEAMVNQAINKSIGLQAGPNQPYRSFLKEGSVLMPLKGMLAKFNWPADGMIAYAEGRIPQRPAIPTGAPAAAPSPSPSPARPPSAQSSANLTNGGRPPPIMNRQNPPPPLPPQYQAPLQRPPQTTQTSQQSQIATPNPQQIGAARAAQPTQPTRSGPVAEPSTAFAAATATDGSSLTVSKPQMPISQPAHTAASASAPTASSLLEKAGAAVGTSPTATSSDAANKISAGPAASTNPTPAPPAIQDPNLKRPRPSDGGSTDVPGPGASSAASGTAANEEPPAKKIAS